MKSYMSELEYLVNMMDPELNPTVENLRNAIRLRAQNKACGWGYGPYKGDSTIDKNIDAARNTAEWKIYDAVEGVDL